MIDVENLEKLARQFNALQVGDRIFYKRFSHLLTRRVQKILKDSVIVVENGIEKTIPFYRIIKA